MECDKCHAPVHEKPLFRNNPKGEKAVWRCNDCLDLDAPTPDEETEKIVNLIAYNGAKELDPFDKMQLERWERKPETDTIFTCSIHNTEFDVEFEPCPKCWEEYENL